MKNPESDPAIRRYREQISDADTNILEALNNRLELVQQLKRYKDEQGLGFVDPTQEGWVLTYLSRPNRGPLSQEALQELFSVILSLTKQEVARLEEEAGQRPVSYTHLTLPTIYSV